MQAVTPIRHEVDDQAEVRLVQSSAILPCLDLPRTFHTGETLPFRRNVQGHDLYLLFRPEIWPDLVSIGPADW